MLESMVPNHLVCIQTDLMTTLQLDPLSDDPLKWPRNIRSHVHQCSEQTVKVDNVQHSQVSLPLRTWPPH